MADPSYSRSGTFRAVRRPDGNWNTGLLTTEGSDEGFMVRAGDVLESRVRLPAEVGAWPAIWTWLDGDNEIDVFEYHPDNPDLLELSNHVKGGSRYHRDPSVSPGGWVDLKVEFGARSVVWWVNGTRVFADRRGWGGTGGRTSSSTSPCAPGATTPRPTRTSRRCRSRSRT